MVKVQVCVGEFYPWFRMRPYEEEDTKCYHTSIEMSGEDFEFCTEATRQFLKAQEILKRILKGATNDG